MGLFTLKVSTVFMRKVVMSPTESGTESRRLMKVPTS